MVHSEKIISIDFKDFAWKLDERGGKTQAALKAFFAPLQSIIFFCFSQTKHVLWNLFSVTRHCSRGFQAEVSVTDHDHQ